ncbi:MAG: Hsp20/alpha crystallin family protein [Candidatus Hodarchaeales archaeon]|jgi:HSP20 family molecular chaperone IbpA
MTNDKHSKKEDEYKFYCDFPPFNMLLKAFPHKGYPHGKGYFMKNFGDIFNYSRNTPLAHVRRDDEGYIIDIEIPGITKEQINLELTNDELWFTAKNEELNKDYRYHLHFRRRIQTDGITAKLKAGILKIKALYLEPNPKRKVDIE